MLTNPRQHIRIAELCVLLRVALVKTDCNGDVDPDTPRPPALQVPVLGDKAARLHHAQVEIFSDLINVDGLVLTKLDGSAKGGVLVALAEKFGLPVHAIGVGEQLEDLQSFDAMEFAESLVGVELN